MSTLHVRGQTAINTMRFVKERFGAEAHERVVAALPSAKAGTFLAPIRDAAWKPLDHTLAYMEIAQRLLAPDDPTFHRQTGRYSGRATGSSAFRLLIGSSPELAVTRSAFMWRFLYDAGRVELVDKAPGSISLRILYFHPPSRAWCDRIAGFLEAVVELAGAREARVDEVVCVHQGAPHCEMRGHWQTG